MVLHGLEGSIKAHSNPSDGGDASDHHPVFPFASKNVQPPLISILRNVKHCVVSFHQRQQDESRYEFHLKVKHTEAHGEEFLDTVRSIFDRVCQTLEGCDVIDGSR